MCKEFRSLISLEEALSIVQSHLLRTATEAVPLTLAAGRILAAPAIRAALTQMTIIAKSISLYHTTQE